MTDQLTSLEDAVALLRVVWAGSDGAAGPIATLDGSRLVAVTEALGALSRRLDAVRARVAAEVDRQSRPELGAESLAKLHGARNGATLLAEATGISTGDAARLTLVGRAVTPGTTLSGEPLPARHPHVADGVNAGDLSTAAAAAIVSMLDRAAPRTTHDDRDRAEQALATQAVGMSLDHVRRLVARAEAWLDPDGVEPAEHDRRAQRAVRLWERGGMLHIDGQVDAVGGAPLRTAIEALVGERMRHTRNDVVPGGVGGTTDGNGTGDVAGSGATGDEAADSGTLPSVAQLRADALVQLAEHALSCDRGDLPLDGTTVVVRMSLDTLRDGIGLAEIDGVTQPVSAATARRLAASADIIPCVLGGDSEVLDWGRRRRLFSRAQRLALVERDGGCAMCHLPPDMTRVHHIAWWARDAGATDLCNGVLLCESCHHRIHDQGWDIRVAPPGRGRHGGRAGGTVWFIPPAAVDPARTPRLGGRARFELIPRPEQSSPSASPPSFASRASAPPSFASRASAPPAPRTPTPGPAPGPGPAPALGPAPGQTPARTAALASTPTSPPSAPAPSRVPACPAPRS